MHPWRLFTLALPSLCCACTFDSAGLQSPPNRDLRADVKIVVLHDAAPDRVRQDGVPDRASVDGPLRDKPSAQLDRPILPPDQRPPDKPPLVPDKPSPDKKAGDVKQWPNTACPCQPPLVCHEYVCRTPCTQDACRQSEACASGESCVDRKSAGYLCLSGGGNLAACDTGMGLYCAQGLLCTTIAGDPNAKCRKLCTPGAGACSGCVKVGSMSCYICT
jgi:hypothetical protein